MKDKDKLKLLQQLELAEHSDDVLFFTEDEKEDGIFHHFLKKNPFPDILPDRGTEEEFSSAAKEAGLFCRMIFLVLAPGCEPL